MNKNILTMTVILLVSLVFGLWIVAGRNGVAAQQPNGSLGNLGNHHSHLTVTLGSGETYLIENPKPGYPIFIQISEMNSLFATSGTEISDNIHFSKVNNRSLGDSNETTLVSYGLGPNLELGLKNTTQTTTLTYQITMWY